MKTYEVTVNGFPPVVYSGQTPSKARAEAWRNYSDAFECSFKEFLSISKVKRCGVPEKDGYDYIRRSYGLDVKVGQRVEIINEGSLSGTMAEVVYPGTSTAHVHVKADGRDDILHVHPSSIQAK